MARVNRAAVFVVLPAILFACSKQESMPVDTAKTAAYQAEAEAVEKARAQREQDEAAKIIEAAKQKRAEADAGRSAQQVDLAINIVKQRLFDEGSAQFRNVRTNSAGDAVCGEVNAKNKMGGYVGYRRFIVMDGMAVVKPEEKGLEYTIFQNFESKASCPTSSDD